MSAAARNAVVTGANKGIGLELVKQLSEGGSYSTIYAICRKSSDGLSKLAGSSNDKIKVLDAIQVTDESAPTSLKEALKDVPIHLLIHNAGAYGPPSSDKDSPIYATQTLTTITAERMRFAFELNTVAPLMLTQALVSNLEQAAAAAGDDGSKVIIISSAMGSIAENGSGGHYGYRTAKAAVNMVGMTLAQDLKGKKIAVSMIHPGFVYTGFAGEDADRQPGQRDVDESTRGVVEAIDKTTIETTGSFFHGNYGEGVKVMPW